MLKLKTILAPVDFSERSLATAEHAVHMANRFGAQLALAHVRLPVPAYYESHVPSAQQAMDAYSREEMSKLVRYGLIDGLPGFVTLEQGGTLQTTALQIEGGRIVAIYVMRNPEKLRHLGQTLQ